MSSDNIFRRSTAVDHSVKPASMFKDRSSPYRKPYKEEKKKKKSSPNPLIDIDTADIAAQKNAQTIFEKITMFIMTLLGKRKEWQETQTRLATLKNRINAFEAVINSANKNSYQSVKHKAYKV